MKLGVELEVIDDQNEELSIKLYGNAEDELQLISKSIIELISQIDIPNCNDDQVTYENEMSKIEKALTAKNHIFALQRR